MITDRDRIYQAAQKYLQKGQLERAIAEYETLVQDDASDLRALLKVGDLQLRLGNTQAATEAYQQVAQSYAQDGFFLKAVAVYKQIHNVEPDNVAVNERLASLYGQLNLQGEATAQYRSLAALHARSGDWAASLAAIEKVRAAGNTSDDVMLHWADMVAKLGDSAAAQRELKRLAQAHHDAGRMDAWARIAERLLALDEALAGLACSLAKHYMDQGDAHAALLKLRTAFQAAPQDDEILALLARAFEALGQISKATAVLHELEQQAGQRGQVQVRMRVLKQIIQLNPNDADAEAALDRLEDEQQARRTGRASLKAAPPPTGSEPVEVGVSAADVAKLVTEATVFHRYGLHRRAIEVLDRILATLPGELEVQQLRASYTGELEQLVERGRLQAMPQPVAPAPASTLTAPKPMFLEDSEETAAAGARSRPKVSPTTVHAGESFSFSDDALDVDALIAAAMPERPSERIATEDALAALAAPQPAPAAGSSTVAGAGARDPSAAAGGADSDPETHFNLGVAYRDMGLFDEAVAQFERARLAPARIFEAPHLAGLCHLAAGRPEAAVAALQAALQGSPVVAEQVLAGHYALGLALRLNRQETLALHHFGEVAKRNPQYRDVATLLQPQRPSGAETEALQALLAPAAATHP